MKANKIPILPCLEPMRVRLVWSNGETLSVNRRQQAFLKMKASCDDEWNIVSDSRTGLVSIIWLSKYSTRQLYLQPDDENNGNVVVRDRRYSGWQVEPTGFRNDYIIIPVPKQGFLSVKHDKTNTQIAIEEYHSADGIDGIQAWSLQFYSGELCHIISPHHDRRICCDIFGNITTNDSWGGWEVWRFIEAGEGNVYITSWTHPHFYLSSTPNGTVNTTKKRKEWEVWRVVRSPGNGVTIRSVAHDTLLRFDGRQLSTTDPHDTGPAQLWHLSAPNRRIFFLSCLDVNKRIGCPQHHDRPPFATRNRKGWEEWEMASDDFGQVTFRSKAHGFFLSSDDTGKLKLCRGVYEAELWILDDCAIRGSFYIKSVKSGMYLTCHDDDDNLCTVAKPEERGSTWLIEPHMPWAPTGQQIGSLALAGVATIGLAWAAPIATAALMGSGSAEAGVAAAGAGTIITTEAAVSGVELGALCTSLAVGGGAILGASSSAVVLAGSGIFNNENNKTSSANEEEVVDGGCAMHRPFSAWRSWQ